MKVAILSMQRVPNYGSFLQAYGLKSILEELGAEAFFCDYYSEKPVVPFSRAKYYLYHLRTIAPVGAAMDIVMNRILRKHGFRYTYRMKYLKYFGQTYRYNYNVCADAVVIGSDEVFNCLQHHPYVGFAPMLFGQNLQTRKLISYAASFGYTTMEGLRKYGVDEKIGSWLETFDSISVRDQNSYDIVKQLTGKPPVINLDPVLIADYKIPKVELSEGEYVILYTYKSRKYSQTDIQSILKFCKDNHKELISFSDGQDWVPNRIEASPFEVLSYFKSAAFIITDTFHGTIFSLKYNKAFAALIRPDNSNKLGDLLNRLHKNERIINDFGQLEQMYNTPVDYSITNAIIEREKKSTISYFHHSLDELINNHEQK